ncbi:MAG: S41 family peptidase [Novosphingobium sp.]|nr:S41 family peptidase [Novosphingobium sp.]MDP3908247.1 S41 family peptidase [Novosphingobium sp.]
MRQPVAQVAQARERLNADNNGLLGYRGQPGKMVAFDLTDKVIEPADPQKHFSGPVAVLIDELTYSAGILFATTLQDHGLAVLAGRPTGGFANQTGNMMPSRLPNTGFTAYIATREFVRPSGDLRVGPVIPDLPLGAESGPADLLALMQRAAALPTIMPDKRKTVSAKTIHNGGGV